MIDVPNEYTYVNQNPWTSFDPEGLSVMDDVRDVAVGTWNFGWGVVAGYGQSAIPFAPVDHRNYGPAFQRGKVVRDGIAIAVGAVDMLGGGTVAAGGGSIIVSVPAVAAGVVVAVYGGYSTIMGANNMAHDLNSISGETGDSTPPGNQNAKTTAKKPYSNPDNRPKYAKGQEQKVWDQAVEDSPDGIVRDPNTGKVLNWEKTDAAGNAIPRRGQWDMGHRTGFEYNKLHSDYMNGQRIF